MTYKEIIDNHKLICENVLGKRLKMAFDNISMLTQPSQLGSLEDRKCDLETTYKYMLQYSANGIEDPEQSKIFRKLQISILELADEVKDAILCKECSNLEYSKKRYYKHENFPSDEEILNELSAYNNNLSIAGLLEESMNSKNQTENFAKEHENYINSMFNKLWLSDKYTEAEVSLSNKIIADENIIFADKCVTISAVTLSLMRTFCEKKFDILLDNINNEDVQIAQRALVGFVLCAYLYDFRISLYDNLFSKISLCVNDKKISERIIFAVKQFIKSNDSEKISKKVNDEIIPEISKISPQLKKKLKIDDLKDISFLDDENPEWQEFMDNSNLTDTLQKFAEMQKSGDDVYLSTFASLKNFAFFENVCNWFMPFYRHSSVLKIYKLAEENIVFTVMLKSPYLCNSDKYSLALGIMQTPEQYRDNITKNIAPKMGKIEEIKEAIKEEYDKSDDKSIIKIYIQDIYRYFKLHPRRDQLADPYMTGLKFYECSLLKELAEPDKASREIGEFYLTNGHYDAAATILEQLVEKENTDAELLQKTGYCYQKQGNYRKALYFYDKADIVSPDNLWTLRKMAFCHKGLKETEIALNLYLKAEQLAPEDMAIQLAIGHCHLEMKNYELALENFFKIEMLSPSSKQVWSPIAWCSFVCGKFQQALRYYDKIDEKNRDQYDWTNIGHVLLCMGERNKAIDCYKMSYIMQNRKFQSFFNAIKEDLPILKKHGIEVDNLLLLLDKMQYESE